MKIKYITHTKKKGSLNSDANLHGSGSVNHMPATLLPQLFFRVFRLNFIDVSLKNEC